MTPDQQTNAFQNDIEGVIDRYRREFDLTMAQAVGVLEVVKMNLWYEGLETINKDK